MGSRIFVVLVFLALAAGGYFWFFDHREPQAGITLAELDAFASQGSAGPPASSLSRVNENDSISIMGLEPETIFYGVLGICAAVLALRVLISLLQSAVERRRWSNELRRQQTQTTAPDPVVLPVYAHRALEHDSPLPAASPPRMRLRDQVPRSTRGPFTHLVTAFAGIVTVFGLLSAGLVYFRLHHSLREQALLRARVTAANVADGASPSLFKNNAAGLRELLRKQAAKPELAYILVEDRDRRIVAHSFVILPSEIAESAKENLDASDGHRVLRVGDDDVYEVAAQVLEGRAGTVRVGMWRAKIDEEVRGVVMPLMAWLVSLTAGGFLIALFLAWRIYRPVLRLVSAAKAISGGDLDTPTPHVQDSGELGELSRAIERMRSSVKAAMVRLNR